MDPEVAASQCLHQLWVSGSYVGPIWWNWGYVMRSKQEMASFIL
jgi:hypothetical protein